MAQHSQVIPVTVGTTAIQLLPLRAEREQVVIFNVAGTLYIKYGTGVSADLFTERLQANEMTKIYKYTGALTAIKLTGSAVVYVTECW